jgi:hypothetical protein
MMLYVRMMLFLMPYVHFCFSDNKKCERVSYVPVDKFFYTIYISLRKYSQMNYFNIVTKTS